MLEIIKSEDSLRQISQDVLHFDKSIEDFCEDLKYTLLKTANAAGLAAIQVGTSKNIFAGLLSSGPEVFINLQILSKESPFLNLEEGCLSFPGQKISTIRYEKVKTRYYDPRGNLHIRSFSNFGAIIIQHESDHSQGVLMFDRQAPKKYDSCFCGSGKKFKFCCWNEIF